MKLSLSFLLVCGTVYQVESRTMRTATRTATRGAPGGELAMVDTDAAIQSAKRVLMAEVPELEHVVDVGNENDLDYLIVVADAIVNERSRFRTYMRKRKIISWLFFLTPFIVCFGLVYGVASIYKKFRRTKLDRLNFWRSQYKDPKMKDNDDHFRYVLDATKLQQYEEYLTHKKKALEEFENDRNLKGQAHMKVVAPPDFLPQPTDGKVTLPRLRHNIIDFEGPHGTLKTMHIPQNSEYTMLYFHDTRRALVDVDLQEDMEYLAEKFKCHVISFDYLGTYNDKDEPTEEKSVEMAIEWIRKLHSQSNNKIPQPIPGNTFILAEEYGTVIASNASSKLKNPMHQIWLNPLLYGEERYIKPADHLLVPYARVFKWLAPMSLTAKEDGGSIWAYRTKELKGMDNNTFKHLFAHLGMETSPNVQAYQLDSEVQTLQSIIDARFDSMSKLLRGERITVGEEPVQRVKLQGGF